MENKVITFNVGADGTVSPATEQSAGVQGSHNVTEIVFDVSALALSDEKVRVQFVDGAGGFYSTGFLDFVENLVTVPIPDDVTNAGGLAYVYLVVSRITYPNGEDEPAIEEETLMSSGGKLRFSYSGVGSPSEYAYRMQMSNALVNAEIFVGQAEEHSDNAQTAANNAQIFQDNASTYAESAEEYANEAEESLRELKDRIASGDFKGEKGEKGDKGDKGDQGEKGEPAVLALKDGTNENAIYQESEKDDTALSLAFTDLPDDIREQIAGTYNKETDTGVNATSLGTSISKGKRSFNSGSSNLSTGKASITNGADNYNASDNGAVFGYANVALKEQAFCGGGRHILRDEAQTSGGHGNDLKGYASSGFGDGLIVSGWGQNVVGRYNVKDADAMFVVGNGTSDTNRSNVFVAKQDGTAYANNVLINKNLVFDTKANLEGFLYGGEPVYYNKETVTSGVTPGGNIGSFTLPAGTYYINANVVDVVDRTNFDSGYLNLYWGNDLESSVGTYTFDKETKIELVLWLNNVEGDYTDNDLETELTYEVQVNRCDASGNLIETYVRDDGITKEDLNKGDLLLIAEDDAPNYWWTGSKAKEL